MHVNLTRTGTVASLHIWSRPLVSYSKFAFEFEKLALDMINKTNNPLMFNVALLGACEINSHILKIKIKKKLGSLT